MKVKKYIGKSINGFTVLDSYKVTLESGKTTRRVLLRCDSCGNEFERSAGVNFEHIKCRCKCKYSKHKKDRHHYIEYNGIRYTLAEFCRQYQINKETFRSKIKSGMTVDEAIQKEYLCVCEICGKEFMYRMKGKKYCCKTCSNRAGHGKGKYKIPHLVKCVVCGNEFESIQDKAKVCSEHCRRSLARIERNRRYRELRERGCFDPSVTLENVYLKYNGICCGCGEHLSFSGDCISDIYPSIDHIIPLSKGGTHEWNNVQLLCRKCNYEKGANNG